MPELQDHGTQRKHLATHFLILFLFLINNIIEFKKYILVFISKFHCQNVCFTQFLTKNAFNYAVVQLYM